MIWSAPSALPPFRAAPAPRPGAGAFLSCPQGFLYVLDQLGHHVHRSSALERVECCGVCLTSRGQHRVEMADLLKPLRSHHARVICPACVFGQGVRPDLYQYREGSYGRARIPKVELRLRATGAARPGRWRAQRRPRSGPAVSAAEPSARGGRRSWPCPRGSVTRPAGRSAAQMEATASRRNLAGKDPGVVGDFR